MKDIKDIVFADAKIALKAAITGYISQHQNNFFKNHTFFAFWKKSGIQRAKTLLTQMDQVSDVKGLLALVQAESGQGVTLSAALKHAVLGVLEITQGSPEFTAVAQKYTQESKVLSAGGVRGPMLCVEAKSLDHPAVVEQATNEIFENIMKQCVDTATPSKVA